MFFVQASWWSLGGSEQQVSVWFVRIVLDFFIIFLPIVVLTNLLKADLAIWLQVAFLLQIK